MSDSESDFEDTIVVRSFVSVRPKEEIQALMRNGGDSIFEVDRENDEDDEGDEDYAPDEDGATSVQLKLLKFKQY